MERTERKAERRGRKARPIQTKPIEQAVEGSEHKTIVDGRELIFKLVNGELVLVSQEKPKPAELDPDRPRFFRLRPLRNTQRKTQSSRRYFYKPGVGERVLRFWQSNFEGAKHDPKKEAVVMVTSRKVSLDFASMPRDFEEVTEIEYMASRKNEEKQ